MRNRRQFVIDAAGASAGMFFFGSGAHSLQARAPAPQAAAAIQRREIRIGQRRVKTVDVHSHIALPEAAEVCKGTALEKLAAGGPTRVGTNPHSLGPERLQTMDEMGIDVQVISINAFWYSAERDLARRLIDVQNQKLAELCAVHPDRFVALASVALQFPELAAQQMEDAIKHTPDRSELRIELAELLVRVGQSGRAIAQYEQALQIAPQDAPWRDSVEAQLTKLQKEKKRGK